MLNAVIRKNDRLAKSLILVVSFVVFIAIVILSRVKVNVQLGFDVHLFARINAMINSTVTILLIAGLIAVKKKKYHLHKRIMLTAIILSVLFLVSYICHHLFSTETRFGGSGFIRYVYFFILSTHIVLAAIILPFILFTAYDSATGQYAKHKKLARYTFPLWLYVSITGVLVYILISPYYVPQI